MLRGASMKFAKFAILAAGVLGLISFFLPVIQVGSDSASPMQIMKGMQEVTNATDSVSDATSDTHVKDAASGVADMANAVKGYIAIMFAPFLAFLAIGGVGVGRKKLGRLGGTGAFLLGAIGLLLSVVLLSVANEKDASGGGPGIGLWITVLAGGVGAVSGLLLLIKPDRG